MAANRRRGSVIAALALSAVLSSAAAVAAELTPQERRGRRIYLEGTSPSGGEITALMGEAAVEVPAAALPCGGCHGHDGQGRPEGGVTPTNITWGALTKPYGVRHQGGREHPPYTPRLLKRAITMGVDPAGTELHVAMPRYRMLLQEMEDLVAYLQRLGLHRDPGLTDDSLRIGTLLPPPGPMSDISGSIRSVLIAACEEVNAGGGIYHRKLDLVTRVLPPDPVAWPAAVEEFVTEQKIFALVGAFIAGAEEEIAELTGRKEIPLVGPFTLHPQIAFPLNRHVFYLFSGLATQGRVLMDFAARRYGENIPAAIVYPREPELERVADAIQKQAEEAAWGNLERRSYPRGEFDATRLAHQLAEGGVAAVFFLDSGEHAAAFLVAADQLAWHPQILAPGSLAGHAPFGAPAGFQGRIFLSFPTLPSDPTRRGIEEYRRLVAAHGLPSTAVVTQISSLVSARVLIEGLKRAGRDLSREKLIEALEGLYEFKTDLTPLISYGPNRRIGALGGHVLSVDLESKKVITTSDWLTLR